MSAKPISTVDTPDGRFLVCRDDEGGPVAIAISDISRIEPCVFYPGDRSFIILKSSDDDGRGYIVPHSFDDVLSAMEKDSND